jgi:hypothetical protein
MMPLGSPFFLLPSVIARHDSAEAIPWRENEIAMHLSGARNDKRARNDESGKAPNNQKRK